MGNARGSIIAYFKDFVLETHGEGEWQKFLNELTPEDAEILTQEIYKLDWYPAPILNRVIEVYDKLYGKGDYQSIIPIAEYIVTEDLSPVFNVFLDLKNPTFILNNTPSLWKRYFDTGKVVVESADDDNKFYKIRLEELADESQVSGRAICDVGIPTWIKTGLHLTGAKNVKADPTECRYQGAEHCILEVRWD